jgi:antitoxin HigA-1
MIYDPAHPGEVLRGYLEDLSVGDAASRLGITRAHLSRVLNGHAGITANMSLRLSAALGTSPEFWLKMQMNHDLWLAKKQISRFKIRPLRPLAAGKSSVAKAQQRSANGSKPVRRHGKDSARTVVAST